MPLANPEWFLGRVEAVFGVEPDDDVVDTSGFDELPPLRNDVLPGFEEFFIEELPY